MNFANVLRAVKKHWVTEIVLFCVVVGAVVGCTLTMTPQYKATAELLIQASSSSSNATDATSQSQAFSASSVSSVSSLCPDILQSDSVLQSVIDNLGLHSNVSQLRQSVSAVVDEKSPVIQIMALYPDSDQVVKIVEESTRQLNKQLSSTLGSSVKVTLPTIQQPVKPLVPSSPNVPACIAIGIIAGLIVALLGAVIREMSDKGVNETSDIQAIIDSPILASIPKAHTVSDGTPAVIVKPRGHAAEEFHRLTTNVSFVTPNELNQSNVLIVTSSNPREGKTTVAVNLAASFAEKGKSVLLIDGDVRHPSVANALDLNNGIGLVSLLAGDVSAKDAIQTYWKPYLHILPSEDQNTTSGIVLGSDAMKDLIDQASKRYDVVIVDTAPMTVANDAVVFAKQGGVLIMVVGQGVAQKKSLLDVTKELKMSRTEARGIVFNMVAVSNAGRSSHYYYEDHSEESRSDRRKKRKSSGFGKKRR